MTATQPARGHVVGLDGLRGLLASAVVVAHVTARFAPELTGRLHLDLFGQAVVTFFVLSGFLISMPFLAALTHGTPMRPWLGSYALARGLRVYPGWIVALLGASLLLHATFLENATAVQAATPSGPITEGVGAMTDPLRLLLHASLLSNYLPTEVQTGISPSWSITIEIAFYLVLPFLMLAIAAVARRMRLSSDVATILPGAVLVVVGLGSRSLAWWLQIDAGLTHTESEWGANWVAVLSRSLPVWADAFGLGVLGAALFQRVRDGRLGIEAIRAWRIAAWGTLAASIATGAGTYVLAQRFLPTAMSVASLAVVLLLVLPIGAQRRAWLPARLAETRFPRWLGATSLGIYLWHYPLLLVWERTGLAGGDSALGALWNLLVVGAATLAVASASYVLVERPAIRLRKRLRRRAPSERRTSPVSASRARPAPPRTRRPRAPDRRG